MLEEIIALLEKEQRGEISLKDLYYSLQQYPTDVRDRTIALYLLENKTGGH